MQRERKERVRMKKILNWLKEHKKYVLIGAGIVLLLAAAFWYGSGSPDSKGFLVSNGQNVSGQAASKTDKDTKNKPGSATGEAVESQELETDAALAAQETNGQSGKKNSSPSGNTGNDGNTRNHGTTGNGRNTGSAGDSGNAGDTGTAGNSATNSQTKDQSSQTGSTQGSAATNGQTTSKDSNMVINPDTGKDKYQTDPVPEGKPEPVEPEEMESGSTAYTCTISISCATILNNMDALDKKKVNLIPKDGWILKPVTVSFQEGESVFDVLQRVCKEKKIHMEFSNTPIYNSAYIEGIYNIYELDVGSLSGWTYKVNDWFPNYGCSRYQLKDGDVISWAYTCNLGKDVGGSMQSSQ